MNAVNYIIKQFGGVSNTAKALKISVSAVSKWKARHVKGVPTSAQIKVLKTAKKMGLKITPHHVIYGTDA